MPRQASRRDFKPYSVPGILSYCKNDMSFTWTYNALAGRFRVRGPIAALASAHDCRVAQLVQFAARYTGPFARWIQFKYAIQCRTAFMGWRAL